MSKRTVKRVLATVLAFTMMWGMCINASAHSIYSVPRGGANSCSEAYAQWDEEWTPELPICIMDDIERISEIDEETLNSLYPGYYLVGVKDADDYSEVKDAFWDAYSECTNKDSLSWGTDCSCKEAYEAWLEAIDVFEATIRVSDGSNFGDCSDSEDCDSSVSGNNPTVSGNTIAKPEADADDKDDKKDKDDDNDDVVVVKTPENDLGTFMDTSKNDINRAIVQLNQAIAAGDAATAQALRTNGVTVDTGVWYSFNLSVYEMIENAGIPVTLKFTYEGQRYSVTIPAGAKVTELCDEKGWCGFLNLAAHYGFELL